MRVSDVTIEWLEEHLEGWEGSGSQFAAWCPAHPDIGTSVKGLSITVEPNIILAKCHSCGATLTDVVAALGEGEQDDDFVVRVSKNKTVHTNGGTKKAATAPRTGQGLKWWSAYTCVDQPVWEALGVTGFEDGVAFTFEDMPAYKVRKPPKEIMWLPKGAVNPPLWPIPPATLPEHVWITEGESDCGTARGVGRIAFSVTKGAKTDLPPNWALTFKERGVLEVTVCTDSDSSGLEMRKTLESAVIDAGLICNLVCPELVLDPFLGENDLNALWQMSETDKEFELLLEKCTVQVDEQVSYATYEEAEEVSMLEEADWIVNGLVAPGDKIMLSGPQKSYKTWIELDLSRVFADGLCFLERPEWKCLKPQRVLLIQEEGSWQRWGQRLARLCLKNKGNLLTMHKKHINFTDSGTINSLIATCLKKDVGVVMFDPLQRMMPGVDENDASATGVVWDEIARLQAAIPHLVVVVVHHANKTERLTWESQRGSSRHAGEVDLGIFVQKMDAGVVRIAVDGRDVPEHIGDVFEGKVEISGEGEKPHFKIDASERVTVSHNQVQEMAAKNKDAVLVAINDGCATKQSIMSVCEISNNTARKYLAQLVEEGKVTETDNGEGKAKTYTLRDELEEEGI